MTETICPRCGSTATPTAFRLGRGDRRCNPCINNDSKAYRARRKAAGNPVRTARWSRAKQAEYEKRAYHENSERRLRHLARSTARNAVKRGKLVRRPCEICGASQVEAHHDDYSKPLAVRWLCPTHHREHHAAQRAA